MEVKGTTTDGAEVTLTPKEVDHAREVTDVALFILSNAVVERDAEGAVTASGGIRYPHDPGHRRRHPDTPRLQVPDTWPEDRSC